MAAGRKQQVVAAVAVALVAAMLLVAAADAAQDCGVSWGTIRACMSYCKGGANANACCKPLQNADFGCLCRNYLSVLQSNPDYANCANKVKSACHIEKAC